MVSEKEQGASVYIVGLICAQWAYIEYLLELLIWWQLKLEPTYGAVLTGPLEIEKRARTADGLAGLRLTDDADILVLKDTLADIGEVKEPRHLAVHGIRALDQTTQKVTATVTRGTKKYEQQEADLQWHRDILTSVEYISARLERLLLKHGIIEGARPESYPRRFPELLAQRYQRKGRIPQGYEHLPPPCPA